MKVVCGGMYRSGSTWQYNAARLILKANNIEAKHGWAHDKIKIDEIMSCPNCILKSHQWHPEFQKADLILSSYRDLRDVVASLHRMFGTVIHLHTAIDAHDRFSEWLPFAHHAMRYETMIEDPAAEVRHLCRLMKLEADPGKILEEIKTLTHHSDETGTNQIDKDNLLWKDHITDGRHGSWKNLVSPEISEEICIHFREFMIVNGYVDGRL